MPFVFAEVALPKAPAGHVPELHRQAAGQPLRLLAGTERRRTGYLLVTPRARDEKELRFHVTWKKTGRRHRRLKIEDRRLKGPGGRVQSYKIFKSSIFNLQSERGPFMSRTTLCAATAAVLALLSLGVMAVRHHVWATR